jgi:hypothetical protein
MKTLQQVEKILFAALGYSSLAFVICALSVQLAFVYTHFTKSDEDQLKIANDITWKIDGRWSDTPGNIWYEEK